jgi:predicted O-methyltransferase YrrM
VNAAASSPRSPGAPDLESSTAITPELEARRRAMLEAAATTPGFFPVQEALALHAAARLALVAAPGPIVEVGGYLGRSSLFLAAACVAAGPGRQAVCFSVDHHHGSEEMQPGWPHHDPSTVDPATGRIDTLAQFRRAIEAAGAEHLVVAVVGDSPTIAANWSTPAALVLLDGGHGADIAWADYRGWARHIAHGGLLAIHDVFPDPADGGRPPYECYIDALASGAFVEETGAGCGSLRILRRT